MRISTIILAAVVALCGPSLLRVQAAPATDGGTATTRPHRERPHPIEAALKATTPAVTDAETAQIKPIMEAFQAKVKAWAETNKDAIQQARADMKAAHESGDKDKMAAARAKMADLRKDAPKPQDLIDQILPILTADQQTSFKAALENLRKEHSGQGGPGGPGRHPKGDAPAAPAQQ